MIFYQAFSEHEPDFTYPLRDTREESQKDLWQKYEIVGLREHDDGSLYDPNRQIGVAIIEV